MTLLTLSYKGTLVGSPLLGGLEFLQVVIIALTKVSVALGNVAQLVECLPSMCKAPASNLIPSQYQVW